MVHRIASTASGESSVLMQVYPDAEFEAWWSGTEFVGADELVKGAAWFGWCGHAQCARSTAAPDDSTEAASPAAGT